MFRLEANFACAIAEIIVEVGLIAIFKANVVEELIVGVGEWVVILHAIVSIVEPANVSGVLVIDGVAEFCFAMCFSLERREAE